MPDCRPEECMRLPYAAGHGGGTRLNIAEHGLDIKLRVMRAQPVNFTADDQYLFGTHRDYCDTDDT